jgi:uncharacterized membrane protein YdfJ with MMPL/SSD domain
VLADAFIVRVVLMPAVLTLLVRSAWWLPKWLDRILPEHRRGRSPPRRGRFHDRS